MFFDNIEDIPKIAQKVGCSIFVIPNGTEIKIKNARIVEKDKLTSISVDQMREVLSHAGVKQTSDQYVIVKEADKLSDGAANAFLKNFEEPKENYHYILQTEDLSKILPTIRSRAEIFILKKENQLDEGIDADEKIKTLAKRLIAAKDQDYIAIMEEIAKKKDDTRDYALKILSTAIEMSYKSYFKTENQVFLKKIPKFIKAYENIQASGHIKLHLVADML